MNLKLLWSIVFLSIFSVACEQEEMVQPKSIVEPAISMAQDAYITSSDPNRRNLIAEEIFEPAMSSAFRKQIYSAYGYGVTNTMARAGSNALRLELRNEGSVIRSEILYSKPVPAEGWHGLSLYLPSNSWQTDNDPDAWAIITQFHGTVDSGDGKRVPPISLSVMKGRLVLAVLYSAKRYNTAPDGKVRFDLGPVIKDKWLDFVYHIKHSYRSDGKLELWMNGKKVVNYNGPNTYNDAETPYLKMGVYKRNWTSATNKNVIFVDEVRMGGSNATYNDVAPKASASTGTPPPPPADTIKDTNPQPLSLVLMNADTQQPILTLTNGTVLDLATLPTRNLNILAISSKKIGSVGFNLTGAQTNSSVQTNAPYSLFGDTGGKVLPWAFTAGNYALTANSFSGINGTGTPGTPLSVNFQVIDQVVPPVENVPPTATLVINNDAPTTSAATVTLNVTAAGATQMRFYDDNDSDVWSKWETLSSTKTWTLSPGTGPKWVKIQVRNAAGLESEEWFDTIILE